MMGIGSHCAGCPHLYIGKFTPVCCKGMRPVPLLTISGCPEPPLPVGMRSPRIVHADGSQTSMEDWA